MTGFPMCDLRKIFILLEASASLSKWLPNITTRDSLNIRGRIIFWLLDLESYLCTKVSRTLEIVCWSVLFILINQISFWALYLIPSKIAIKMNLFYSTIQPKSGNFFILWHLLISKYKDSFCNEWPKKGKRKWLYY